MEFRILGPLEARDDAGTPLALGRGRARSLLAALLLRANEVVSSERLIDDLWGAVPPRTAAKALQGHVSQLRRSGLPLETEPPGYRLRVEPGAVDAHRFAQLVRDGRRALAAGEPQGAAAALQSALALWRGPALPEFAFDAFAAGETARLAELRLAALEERIEADLALGRHADVVGELEALVAEHPLRERPRGQLMLALYRSGRQAEALQQYRSARDVLVGELGLEPGEPLRRLERAILAHDARLDVTAARPAPVPPDSVAIVDPRDGRVAGHVKVGRRPVAIAVGHGSVWVGNAGDGTVSRIDPDARQVVRTIGIGAPAIDLVAGPGAVWVATGSDGTVARLDPATDAVVETIDLRGAGELVWNPVYAVDAGDGAVWVATGPRGVVRLDAETGGAGQAVDAGHVPLTVTLGAGALWVTTIAERLLRIEPRTGEITARAAIGVPVAAAAGEAAVWVADTRARVWRIDAATAAVDYTVTAGERPVGLLCAAGAVWVADGGGALLRLDAATGRVVSELAVGHSPTAVASAFGSLWVAVQGAD